MNRYSLTAWIVAAMSAPLLGAPQEDEMLPVNPSEERKAGDPAAEKQPKLPEPLSQITGNFDDLEKTGYFKIIDGGYGRTREMKEQAIIWTVEVVKPLTCGHAMILFKRLSDVRFYKIFEDGYEQQLLTSQLFYSPWIEEGAVSHEILGRDERFQVWLLMNERRAFVLEHEGANRVVFAEPKRRNPGHKDLWRETRRYRMPEAYSRIPHRAVGAH